MGEPNTALSLFCSVPKATSGKEKCKNWYGYLIAKYLLNAIIFYWGRNRRRWIRKVQIFTTKCSITYYRCGLALILGKATKSDKDQFILFELVMPYCSTKVYFEGYHKIKQLFLWVSSFIFVLLPVLFVGKIFEWVVHRPTCVILTYMSV